VSALRVSFGMKLAGALGVLGRMQVVPMREVRVVSRLVMRLVAVVLGRLAVMLGGSLVMFGRLVVMLGQFRRFHSDSPNAERVVCPRPDSTAAP
jgi:hypothetical protein